MAGNFRGTKFSWMSSGKHFAKKIQGLANYQTHNRNLYVLSFARVEWVLR